MIHSHDFILALGEHAVVRRISVQFFHCATLARQAQKHRHAGNMATTYETLRADIIIAMKARDSVTATILRTADAAIQRASMDTNQPIEEDLVIASLRKGVKNLKDANVEFTRGGRADLVATNDIEIGVLSKYLPQGIEGEKLEALILAAIAETGAQSKKEMGKVIGALKKLPEAGLIDFGAVSKSIQLKLP